MLEAEPVERLGVVDGRDHSGGPRVLEVGANAVPHFHQEMVDSTSLYATVLVGFAGNLCTKPV